MQQISLVGLLLFALAAFAYFGLVRRQARQPESPAQVGKDVYYCPMHKTYQSDKPGNCPICSMKLVKVEHSSASRDAAMKSEPSSPPMNMASVGAAPQPGSSDNAIFVPPEKQQ